MALPTLTEAAQMSLLNPIQRDFLERSVQNCRRALRRMSADFDGGTNEVMWTEDDAMAPDPGDVRESLNRDQNMLNKYSPHAFDLKPYDIGKAWRWVQMLTDEITQGMPSDNQMNDPTAQNIDLHMRWTDRCLNGRHPKYPGLNLIQARSTLIRLLDPDNDDPHLTSIERIRPRDDAHVDWKTYYSRFDEIQFGLQDKVEEALEELDEDRFSRFCQLKAADWAPKNIQRELGFSAEMYEACMQRLRALRDTMQEPEEPDEPDELGDGEPEEDESEEPQEVGVPVPTMPAAPDEPPRPVPTSRLFASQPPRPPTGLPLRNPQPPIVDAEKHIRTMMEERGLSQATIAKALRMPTARFSNMLRGHTRMPRVVYDRFHALMRALDADPSLLPQRTPTPPAPPPPAAPEES